MHVVDSLLNRSEEVAYRELQNIADDNGLRVFAKPKLSDVIAKGQTKLTKREFDYFTRAHCDFVVTDEEFRPQLIVEYDGPFHADTKQMERDHIKNELCHRSELGILRINDKHVTRLYRGMTVLRWIIEVIDLQKAFDEAQKNGKIPPDEPFDPAMFSGADGKDWPYWLSSDATQTIHTFFRTLTADVPKGWNSILGSDGKGTDYRLSCLFFGDKILYSKTAVRNQNLEFPHYDLLNELDTCELGIQFQKFRRGEVTAINASQFKSIFEEFCERFNAKPSHSMGGFPFGAKWSSQSGWRCS